MPSPWRPELTASPNSRVRSRRKESATLSNCARDSHVEAHRRRLLESLPSRAPDHRADCGLAIATVDDLRERILSIAESPDWQAHLKRSWEDFDYAPPGGETCRVAQTRVVRVLDTIASRHSTGRDPREPRQSDRARAVRIHAKRRLRFLGINPDACSVHADSGSGSLDSLRRRTTK